MKLLEKYELNLKLPDLSRDPLLKSAAKGAVMHGVLFSELNKAGLETDELHSKTSRFRPYTQTLSFSSCGNYKWTINLLCQKQSKTIKSWLESGSISSLFIEKYDLNLDLVSIESESKTYESLFDEAISALPPKYASFSFLSPLIFKKSGFASSYPFPEARLIMQSILSRWNEYSDIAAFADKEILDHANQSVKVQSFKLNSVPVDMDSQRLVAANGFVAFMIEANEYRQLMHLCGLYSKYCGIGAKTAMGLGAVSYQPNLPVKK